MYGGFSWKLRIIESPPRTFSGPCVWECSKVTQFEVYLSRTATNFMSWKMTVFLKFKKKKKNDSILSIFVRKRSAISTPSFPWRENAVSEMGDSCLSLGMGCQSSKVLIGEPQSPAPEFWAGRTQGPRLAEFQSFIFSLAKKLAFCKWSLFIWLRTSHHVFIKNRWSLWYMTLVHSLVA